LGQVGRQFPFRESTEESRSEKAWVVSDPMAPPGKGRYENAHNGATARQWGIVKRCGSVPERQQAAAARALQRNFSQQIGKGDLMRAMAPTTALS